MCENQNAVDDLLEQKQDLLRKQEEMQDVIKCLEEKLDCMKIEVSVSQTDTRQGQANNLQDRQKLEEVQKLLDEERGKTTQLTSQLLDQEQQITNLSNFANNTRNEVNDKNRIIDELNKICNDKEWSLGEHRQWLSESHQRIDWLEGELTKFQKLAEAKCLEVEQIKGQVIDKDKEIEVLNAKIKELPDVTAQRELSPSDKELKMLQERLRSAEERAESLQGQLDDLRTQRDYLQQQLEAEVYRESSRLQSGEVSPGIESSMLVEDVTEELIKASKKVYEKEEQLKEVELELNESLERCKWLEEEKRKMGEELWIAKERVANQDREITEIRSQINWERNENERLRQEIEAEKQKYAETGGVDYSKFDALRNEMREQEARLLDEKSKVEWHLGEVKQWWNDAKWRVGELEADISHRQWLLDQANQKAYHLEEELNGLRQFRDMAKDKLNGTFLIRKQPFGERTKWRLAMWTDDSPDDLQQYRRVWFEITAPGANVVALSASFVNWECSLTCDNFDKEQGKFGVWVDIPPGRYEFCFVVDGRWTTCDLYPTVTNEFGTQNNWRYIN